MSFSFSLFFKSFIFLTVSFIFVIFYSPSNLFLNLNFSYSFYTGEELDKFTLMYIYLFTGRSLFSKCFMYAVGKWAGF